MLLRLFALLLLFCATTLSTRARAQVLTVSEELALRSDTRYHLLGKLGGQVLLLQDRDTKHLLTAFGRNMNQTWEKELELRGRNIRLLESVAQQDGTGFNLLYLYRENGRNHLQLDRYNPAGNLADSTTLIDFGLFLNNPEDRIILSQDETKALVMITENSSRIRCIGIDLDGLELLYDILLEPEKFFFGEDFLQAEVSNAGDMYFIVERDNFKSRRKEHRYEVHTIEAASKRVANFDFNLGDSLTYDVYFQYDNRNARLTGAGLYSTRDLMRADGYFFVTAPALPAVGTIVRPTFHQFPITLVQNIEGKQFRKKNPTVDQISVRDVVLRRDGGLVLITERNRQLQRRSSAAQMQVLNSYSGRPLVDHHYNEIVAFGIHPDGRPHWSNIMHKKQYSQDDGGVYSSFFLMESPSSLRFLFNDEIRFENTVSEYVMNGRGEFDRNSLFNTRDLNLRLRFRDGVQVAANELVMPSEHRNKLRLVKMTYERAR